MSKPQAEGPILRVERVSKAFGGLQAISRLSFDVKPGEILGLIGPNGAGKTTIFNLIMGVIKPDQGEIHFQGRRISGWRQHRIVNAGIARTFQIPKPFHHKTIAKNVEIALIPNSIAPSSGGRTQDRQTQIASLCTSVGICRIFGHDGCSRKIDGLCSCELEFPSALPHAALRNLEIAKALASDPQLLLLDEPFAGLTNAEVESMSQYLLKLKSEGLTQVLVDHNMRGLMRLVDRVVVINFGQKLAEGSPKDVAADERVQEAYLAGSSSS